MVDYVAVLRRTIDALPKNTPEIRNRVYDKARATVESKLAMISPPPSQALIAKQMSGLEAAITTVEADFAVAIEPIPEPVFPELDPLDTILNGLPEVKSRAGYEAADTAISTPSDAVRDQLPPKALAPLRTEQAQSFELPELPELPRAPLQINGNSLPDTQDRPRLPDAATLDFLDQVQPAQPTKQYSDGFDDVFADPLPPALQGGSRIADSLPNLDEPIIPPGFTRAQKPKVKRRGLLLPLVGLALIGGAGALAWTERDRIIAFLQPEQPTPVTQQPQTPAQPEAPAGTPPATAAETPAPQQPAANAPQKFTQRLNPDGTEVDAGQGAASGEQSLAQLAPAAETPAQPTTPAVETPAAETPAAAAPAETPAPPVDAMPVGQKAIFYEERTSGSEGSARPGAVVWSVVRESPGNDRPPEPAIRGELTIPEAGLNVRMTLRRNADATLPASHILELIMSVPDGFSGGTIEDVQRVNLKPSEESAGAPLAATPVKVADKFFLVALENTPAAQEANLALLRDQSWIDLPVVYRTGRRALFTMEKGLVGDQVFKQVLDAWIATPLQ